MWRNVSIALLFVLLLAFGGCGNKADSTDLLDNTGVVNTVEPDSSDVSGEDLISTDTAITEDNDAATESDVVASSAAVNTDYLAVDVKLGRPLSNLYTFSYVKSEDETAIVSVIPSVKYAGFLETKMQGNSVLLTPDLKVVKYPKSSVFRVLEPFLVDGKLYFRVEYLTTNWVPIPENHEAKWWTPLGGYAVLDADGKTVIPFEKYDYIDRFVDGKSRAQSTQAKSYYIIDVTGKILKEYPMSGNVMPYRLYPDGYIYTRSDKDNKHSHSLVSWDDKVVIPYFVYKDDFFPKYLDNKTFLVNNDVLMDGKLSGLILYTEGKPYRKLTKESNDVFSAQDGKFVTGMITNGLAGPLAKWDYKVTDESGKVLIERGLYTFISSWYDGYAVATTKQGKTVLLNNLCTEVDIPEGLELTGRYADDASLFTVKVTKDFEFWRYNDVPERYDNLIGVVDKDFNWVIPPGEVDYLRNLPKTSVALFCEYKRGDENSLLLIHKK